MADITDIPPGIGIKVPVSYLELSVRRIWWPIYFIACSAKHWSSRGSEPFSQRTKLQSWHLRMSRWQPGVWRLVAFLARPLVFRQESLVKYPIERIDMFTNRLNARYSLTAFRWFLGSIHAASPDAYLPPYLEGSTAGCIYISHHYSYETFPKTTSS